MGLAERSASILINQVYRFSAFDVMRNGRTMGFQTHLQRIQPGVVDYPFTMGDPALGSGTRSCGEWQKLDAALDKPIEFHPRYMHCLIADGRTQATASKWAAME